MVLSMSAKTKILSAVVEAIAVSMIDVNVFRSIHQPAVKVHTSPVD